MMLDTELNEWTILDKEPNTRRFCHYAAILADGTIIVCGGYGSSGRELDSIEIISFKALTGIGGTYSLCIAGYYIHECILHYFSQHAQKLT